MPPGTRSQGTEWSLHATRLCCREARGDASPTPSSPPHDPRCGLQEPSLTAPRVIRPRSASREAPSSEPPCCESRSLWPTEPARSESRAGLSTSRARRRRSRSSEWLTPFNFAPRIHHSGPRAKGLRECAPPTPTDDHHPVVRTQVDGHQRPVRGVEGHTSSDWNTLDSGATQRARVHRGPRRRRVLTHRNSPSWSVGF